jgi:hypothetical protein
MQDLCCPECNAILTLKQAIEILNGSGYQRTAKIQMADGQSAFVPAHLVNPNEVMILE